MSTPGLQSFRYESEDEFKELWKSEKERLYWQSKATGFADGFKFMRVHEYTQKKPWCVYIMEHPSTIAASSLKQEDLSKFQYNFVDNLELFEGCYVKPKDTKIIKEFEQHVSQSLQYINEVVPYEKVMDLYKERNAYFCKQVEGTKLVKEMKAMLKEEISRDEVIEKLDEFLEYEVAK